MPRRDTKSCIQTIAQELVSQQGLDALSFDAIAARLGTSKQAVLYWYPSKAELMLALFLPWLRAEVAAAREALEAVSTPAEAAHNFATAIAAFHTADLERFRAMYLLPQTTRQSPQAFFDRADFPQVHEISDQLYSCLAAKLGGDPPENRRAAFSLHTSVLGIVMMVALCDRLQDPLAHSTDDLIATLVGRFCATGPATPGEG